MTLSELLKFDPSVANDMTLSEKLENILTTGVGGYILVFAVMALIWIILELFGKVFSRNSAKKPESAKKEETAAEPAETAPESAFVPEAYVSDEETVAAIVAAISAYTGKAQTSFRVVSFRRK